MQAMYMETEEAVNAIGDALANLADTSAEGEFLTSIFHMRDDFFAEAGRPSLTVRYVGIVEDGDYSYEAEGDGEYITVYASPQIQRFEGIIYHPDYAPPELGVETDGYEYAQRQTLRGLSAFRKALKADLTLGNLVHKVDLISSVADDLLDPRNNTVYYGHDLALIVHTY